MTTSAVANLLSGVVQGSGIGPALSLIHTDDMAKFLETNGITAATCTDDAELYLEHIQTCIAGSW